MSTRESGLAAQLRVGDNVRIALVGAAGGAGTTTAATLVTLGMACAYPLVVSVATGQGDDGALGVRWGVDDGLDLGVLAGQLRSSAAGLAPAVPGAARCHAGTAEVVVVGSARSLGFQPTAAADAGTVLSAAARTSAPVVLDAGRASEQSIRAIAALATHVLVVAPRTVTGLLAAEFAIEHLAVGSGPAPRLAVLLNDPLGRSLRRRARASLARLDALEVPRLALPFDRCLSEDPAVEWTSLAAPTRTAVLSLLSSLLGKA